MNSNVTIKISQNLNSWTQKSNIARELSKEITRINTSKIFTSHNGIGYAYPVVTHFFDFDDVSESGQNFLKDHSCQNNFCFFDEKESVYKIYIAGHSDDYIKKYYNSSQLLNFRGKKINISDDLFKLKKELSLSLYRHELAHIKISEIDNFEQIKNANIPFQLFNILEDVRVNSYWNSDKNNFRVINSELIKIKKDVLSSSATGYDILFPVCVTMDDPKYNFLSPDYPFVKDIFERTKLARSPLEVVDLCKEFLEEMQKRYPNLNNNQQQQQNNQNQQNNQQNNQQQQQSNQNQQNNQQNNQQQNQQNNKNDMEENFGKNSSHLQKNNANKRIDEEYDEDDEYDEEYEEEISSDYQDSNRREIDPSNDYSQDNFLQENAKSQDSDMSDLINGSLSQDELEVFTEILQKELEKKSFKIDPNGLIVPPDSIGNEFNKNFTTAKNHRKNDNKIDLLPSAKSVQRGALYLDTLLLNSLVNYAKKELGKYFPQTKQVATSEATHRLNPQELYSIPINPQLERVFLKKGKPNPKEPIKISIFQDLSGSMSGSPLNISKHIIATLKKLQDLGYIDVTMFFHADQGVNSCHVINLKDVKEKALERISNLRTYGSDGIINAASFASQKYHTALKNSRFVLFFTDGCLNDSPNDIKKALKKLNLDKVVGIYADTYGCDHNLNAYFGNNISFRENSSRQNKAQEIKRTCDLILKTICLLANPDLSAQNAIRRLSHDKDIIANFYKNQIIDDPKIPQKEEVQNNLKIKI